MIGNIIIQGTTPRLDFELPFDSSNLTDARVLFCQKDKLVFKKVLTDCNLDGAKISFKLTQEETLKLDDRYELKIQVKVKTVQGDVLASDDISVDVARSLEAEVI